MTSVLYFAALVSYGLTVLLRGMRLWLCLGSLRPPVALVLLASAGGVALSWETSWVLVYEAVVLVTLAIWERRIFFHVLYCLLILRAFDAAAVLAISLTTMPEGKISNVLFLFGVIFFSTCGAIYTVEPVLMRAERFVIELPNPYEGDTRLLIFLNRIRAGLGQLSWNRKGTLPALLFLTGASWFFEWLALFLVSSAGNNAAHAITGRILFSLGYASTTYFAYEVLMPVCYVLFLILALWSAWKIIRVRRCP